LMGDTQIWDKAIDALATRLAMSAGSLNCRSGSDTRITRTKGMPSCPITSTPRWRLRPASCTSTTCTCSPARAAGCSSWTSTPMSLSGWRPEKAVNSLAGTIVDSIVLEVSHQHPQLRPGARTGVWCATKLATDAGGWRQINRAGHPMMWPIFWPADTQFTNPANTRHPSEDVKAAAEYISEQVAAVVAASGTSGDPEGYGKAVAADLFPDVLPYVIGTPAVYGFAARNGRTPADNAPEAMLSLVTSTAVPSGLKPSVAKDQRASSLPYIVPA
jgi:hypothetical protein